MSYKTFGVTHLFQFQQIQILFGVTHLISYYLSFSCHFKFQNREPNEHQKVKTRQQISVCNICLLGYTKWMYKFHKILLDIQTIYAYKVKKIVGCIDTKFFYLCNSFFINRPNVLFKILKINQTFKPINKLDQDFKKVRSKVNINPLTS